MDGFNLRSDDRVARAKATDAGGWLSARTDQWLRVRGVGVLDQMKTLLQKTKYKSMAGVAMSMIACTRLNDFPSTRKSYSPHQRWIASGSDSTPGLYASVTLPDVAYVAHCLSVFRLGISKL
ncbi:hypothetical protein RRG08_060480 [Elysia crispata]|uniref:Uncharacterized protein n=1 Tax=Elysia crispata TaxID=231223 RepID=A0AAE1B1F6_9GAST|nr:hypothetical protein RRG08_060480 [Elysia crispata]